MDELYRPLFNARLLASRLNSFAPVLSDEQREIAARWARTAASPAFRDEGEREFQGQFLTEVFGGLLGYTPAGSDLAAHHLRAESASPETGGGRTPDARLGWFGAGRDHTRVVVELKAPRINLDTRYRGPGHPSAVDQAFGYLGLFDDCRWAIVSNFREIRLYSKQRGQGYAHRFAVAELTDPVVLRRCVYLLGRDRLLAEPPAPSAVDVLLLDSARQERDVGDQFYGWYREARLALLRDLGRDNPPPPGVAPAEHQLWLLGAAQKILDRLLFIRFCEDSGLLPDGILLKAYEFATNTFRPCTVWAQLVGLFRAVDRGHPPLHVHGYNGGLFRTDPALDALRVDDATLLPLQALAEYDFLSDVNVTILGHIFEQSVADLEDLRAAIQGQAVDPRGTRRKREGIFYTPESITEYIVEQTVGVYLRERFAAIEARHAPEQQRGAARQARAREAVWEEYQGVLRDLRVLDPACGSGAFLVAAFDYLRAEYARANDRLAELRGGQPTLFDLDRVILQGNLYGVDLNFESVEITRLGLWIKTARLGKPLHDLDATIRCGNSLVAPHPLLPPELAARAFDWHAAFPEVMARGGFDVVIGNPPYIRQEWLGPCKPAFEREFAAYSGTADAYLYFFERGLQLLRPGGRLGFITSGTFASANFAAPFRRWLPTVARFATVVNYGENQPFAEAEMVFPSISILVKDPSPRPCRYYFMRGGIPKSLGETVESEGADCGEEVYARPEWRFQASAITRLADHLMATGRPLGEIVGGRICYGVKTGLNEAFIVDRATRDRLVAADPGCAAVLHPLLRGEDLRPWYYEDEGRWLIFLRPGSELEGFPTLAAHLAPFRERLEPRPEDWPGKPRHWPGRKPGNYQWFELQDTVDYYPAFAEPKVLWPDIAKLPRFAWDEAGCLANNKCYLIPGCPRYLHAVLQSRIAWFCLSQMATPLRLRGGLWQCQPFKQFVMRLPVPAVTAGDQAALGDLALRATALARERYALHRRVRHRVTTDVGDGSHPLNQALTAWWALDFRAFRRELQKALHADLPLAQRDDWEQALAGWRAEHERLTAALVAVEEEINDRAAGLFGLSADDRRALLAHMEQSALLYPLGEP